TSGTSDPDFLYCDIEGDSSAFGGNGAGYRYTGLYKDNINSDPLFSDTLYHLSSSSPCVDAGHPDAIYNDPEDPNNPGYALAPALGTVRNDIGAFGGSIVLEIEKFDIKNIQLPEQFILAQNYPNPFNPRTNIQFSIPRTEFVTLKIYNLLGQEVSMLVSDKLTPGNYKYTWDASGLASGSYYYRIKAGTFTETKKLLLLK
ncbi:T9SS type A sorting domain-containing protein, partial [Calditrichota bacterium]